MVSKNLTFLRKRKKLSQKEVANCLQISRTTWINYEKGKSEPSASALKKISQYFDLKVDDIIFKELALFLQTNEIIKNENSSVLVITIDEKQKENIELVPIKATAGYALNFSNPVFIRDLPRFSIPKLNEGTYRAFEIKGTSMLPVNEGDIVVGRYIADNSSIRYKKRNVVILKGEDVVFKRIFKDLSDKDKLILVSDNPNFEPYTVNLVEVAEIWEMVAHIRYGDVLEKDNDFLFQKINQIEQKINQMIDYKH